METDKLEQSPREKLSSPPLRGIPYAPPRFVGPSTAEPWRVGYADAVLEGVVHRRYEDPEQARAYSFGYASGVHRLFAD